MTDTAVSLESIIVANAEEVLKQYWGAKKAVATVEGRDDDFDGGTRFVLDVTYEGKLEQTDELFGYDDPEGFQVMMIQKQSENKLLLTYVMSDSTSGGLAV